VRGTKVPRGGGYGVVGEALTGLWRVAQADDRLADLRQPLADRAECIAGLSIDAQHHGGPAAEDGAWFIGDITRMDDQQHATSALLRTTAIVELTPSSGHPAPSAWLWGLALLAVLNPLLVGLAVPERPRRGDRANLAALGGVIGGVIVVIAAAVGEPLFDALGVSRPAGRLAVGIVAGVLSVLPLVRGAPRAADGPPGLGAALVPVGIPLVAGPAIVLLGLAAGADLGVGFVAGVMAIGVGLVAASTLAPTEGRRRVVAAWGVRLIAALAVAACALLVVNAVLDV
jgi:small neutral amino acid transporter SnatA (MarC family)